MGVELADDGEREQSMPNRLISSAFLSLGLLLICCLVAPPAAAEFRSAKDMQKECRIALSVLDGTAEKTSDNMLLAGECVGYVQGAVDVSLALADNLSWYKVCVPDKVSTGVFDSEIYRLR